MANYKTGESLVKDFLNKNGYEVEDVSKNPDYWEIDIDILAFNPRTGGRAAIEVKYDGRINRTQNFYIETYNPRSKGKKGYFYFTKADFIYYIDSITNTCYILKLSTLKDCIKEICGFLRTTETDDGSRGYLLPIEKAPIFKVVELS